MTTFVFDGSFEGLLTAIFEFYELKPGDVHLVARQYFQPGLLDDHLDVVNNEEKAKRVWEGLKKKLSPDWQQRFYKTFLSETPESFRHLFDFARYIFDNPKGAEANYGHPSVMAISKMDRSVNRERHRMKAFIRFQETADGIFYAGIEPDYNVLPLIAGFFKNRYADQKWIIYDTKRNYGLFYDLDKVDEIRLDHAPQLKDTTTFLSDDITSEKEGLFGLLWNDYFKSTNIPARKNMKLHVQHVPKRYWKYLTEKQTPETLYFIAIVPPKNVSDKIISIQREFGLEFGSSRALKVMPHITLKAPFKILQPDAKNIESWFQGINISQKEFSVTVSGFGSFGNSKAPVIYAKPDNSPELQNLQTEIIKAFEFKLPGVKLSFTDQKFTPHITVAYRDLSYDHYLTAWEKYKILELNLGFKVSSVNLFRHDGTSWKPVSRIVLDHNLERT